MSKKVQKKAGLLTDDIAGVNQICPVIYNWAWDTYIKAVANNWVPTEVPMNRDIEQWRSKTDLTEDERTVIKRCLGFFAGSESLVANNLLLSIFRWVTNPECRQYIGRQNYEELLHNHTIVYICDSLSLDISEIYEAYKTVPSIKAKDDFLMGITSDISRPEFNTTSVEGKRELVRNLLSYYIICEGIMFFSGFAMLLSFGRQNKLPGISEQIQYTLRDESLHIQFGVNLINTIRKEHPSVWNPAFEKETIEHIKKAVDLEILYAYDVMPNGILGLNAPMFIDYVQYIANRRLESLGLDFKYNSDINPFPWMSEVIDLQKNKNFFESRVTDYATGIVKDDF